MPLSSVLCFDGFNSKGCLDSIRDFQEWLIKVKIPLKVSLCRSWINSFLTIGFCGKVGICELPYHPISSEVIGGVGGTWVFSNLNFAVVYILNSVAMGFWNRVLRIMTFLEFMIFGLQMCHSWLCSQEDFGVWSITWRWNWGDIL